MGIIDEALAFEQRKMSLKSLSERIIASNEAKRLILSINEIYKENRDPKLMDIMKRLTLIKRNIEKRLKARLTV